MSIETSIISSDSLDSMSDELKVDAIRQLRKLADEHKLRCNSEDCGVSLFTISRIARGLRNSIAKGSYLGECDKYLRDWPI